MERKRERRIPVQQRFIYRKSSKALVAPFVVYVFITKTKISIQYKLLAPIAAQIKEYKTTTY
jgi:hypothetical protein